MVIPAYNEEAIIHKTIYSSSAVLSELFDEYEIIIINDHSKDQTGKIVENISKENPNVIVYHNQKNLGIGRSLYFGLQMARYELIIHNGADSPFNIKEIPKMLTIMDNSDIVVATRIEYSGYTIYRRIVSAVNLALLQSLFDLKLNDYNFVQLFRNNALKNNLPDAKSTGFLIPEILFRAHRKGYRINQINIKYNSRYTGKAKAGKISEIVESLFDMIRYLIKSKN